MRFFKSQRGAELSEIVAGLLVVLVAGVAATSVMFNGLDSAATKISSYLGGLTIPVP
jgi:Flp pilus assembly pilin Flp